MALIQFPHGRADAGLSVYQKLRELKHLHEVAWTDELRYKRPEEFSKEDKEKIAEEESKARQYRPIRNKAQRGTALNAQKKNCIADMAAVLSGQGSGNKIAAVDSPGGSSAGLVQVSVRWANDQDKEFAESWPDNVEHGMLNEPSPP